MISNFCEDQKMADNITEFHEKVLENCELPKWTKIKCPFCHKDLPLRSVRAISMRFNTRNLGDVTLEFFCIYCSKMDTLYFRNQSNNISDFIGLLSNNREIQCTSMIEEDMYKSGYNNVMEKMIVEKSNGNI